MQVTIYTHDMNSKELDLLEAIIRSRKERQLEYENSSHSEIACCEPSEPVETKPEPHQPELPFGDAVIDTSKNEAPKVTSKKPPKPSKKVEEVSEPTPVEENDDKVTEEPKQVADEKVTLDMIKERAQTLVQKVSRDAVKNVITKYAEKLSEVKPEDYTALMSDFEALEG